MKKPIDRRSVPQEVKDALAASSGSTGCDDSTGSTVAAVSFATDISPVFQQFRGPMAWRLDLTDYNAVLGNAQLIYDQLSAKAMPPPPFAPLSDAQIEMFKQWMEQGCPP